MDKSQSTCQLEQMLLASLGGLPESSHPRLVNDLKKLESALSNTLGQHYNASAQANKALVMAAMLRGDACLGKSFSLLIKNGIASECEKYLVANAVKIAKITASPNGVTLEQEQDKNQDQDRNQEQTAARRP